MHSITLKIEEDVLLLLQQQSLPQIGGREEEVNFDNANEDGDEMEAEVSIYSFYLNSIYSNCVQKWGGERKSS